MFNVFPCLISIEVLQDSDIVFIEDIESNSDDKVSNSTIFLKFFYPRYDQKKTTPHDIE
jgi:hypothetical protein